MNTHIWRYLDNTRNYPGYHLSADKVGCSALLSWLQRPSERTEFKLQPVTAEVLSVPNNQGGRAAITVWRQFRLKVLPSALVGHFRFLEESGRLTLECSEEQFDRFVQGVEDIARGRGDYCIRGDTGDRLWFWWYPNATSASR